jgi:hypothetical protein
MIKAVIADTTPLYALVDSSDQLNDVIKYWIYL